MVLQFEFCMKGERMNNIPVAIIVFLMIPVLSYFAVELLERWEKIF